MSENWRTADAVASLPYNKLQPQATATFEKIYVLFMTLVIYYNWVPVIIFRYPYSSRFFDIAYTVDPRKFTSSLRCIVTAAWRQERQNQ